MSGSVFVLDVPENLNELPLPPSDALGEKGGLEGLRTEALERFRAKAVPEPGPVLRQHATRTNDARLAVPTTLVCCSIPSAQIVESATSLRRTGRR
ncbi:hypothetical protein LQ384_28710 [Rhodococcus rhodochrous]|uniref:Uncharacterized protein n=1 Tax=Rhodococcus rhodochrous TaxID=1829 RepID=A0AAW4XPN3_RHORH|nr:hypothetical protein [Rhodococcus rhodochrous]MCD2115057.1 hypothetical protein [Rhodococcus rhodochrous]